MLDIQVKRFLTFKSDFIKKIFPADVEVHSFDSTGGYFKIDIENKSVSKILESIISKITELDSEAYIVSFFEENKNTTVWVGNKNYLLTRKFDETLLTKEVYDEVYLMESTYQAKVYNQII